jgi:hypothetical protein
MFKSIGLVVTLQLACLLSGLSSADAQSRLPLRPPTGAKFCDPLLKKKAPCFGIEPYCKDGVWACETCDGIDENKDGVADDGVDALCMGIAAPECVGGYTCLAMWQGGSRYGELIRVTECRPKNLDHRACDDGAACTLDACTVSGCVHTARHDECDDGDMCTAESCDPDSPAADELSCVTHPGVATPRRGTAREIIRQSVSPRTSPFVVGTTGSTNFALTSFNLEFEHGDRVLERAAIYRAPDETTVDFDGFAVGVAPDRNWTGTASWARIPGDYRETSGTCSTAVCSVLVPGLDSTQEFVLAGFDLAQSSGGHEHHGLKVTPDLRTTDRILVTLRERVQTSAEIAFRIAYVLVPKCAVESVSEIRPTPGVSPRTIAGLPGRAEDRVLGGFSMMFSGAMLFGANRHPLMKLGVDLRAGTLAWQDQNTDDAIDWSVRVVLLKPNALCGC